MKKGAYVVKSTRQLLAISSPGREEIIDAVGLIGPCTVPELARFLGRSRHVLYYHVRALRACGLLLESRQSGDGKKSTSSYDVPGRPLSVHFDLGTKRTRRAVVALARSRLKSAMRGFLRACHPDVSITDGPRRNLWATHWKGHLSAKELAEFNRHLVHLVDMLRRGTQQKGARGAAYEFTFALAPVVSAEAARSRRKRRAAAGHARDVRARS